MTGAAYFICTSLDISAALTVRIFKQERFCQKVSRSGRAPNYDDAAFVSRGDFYMSHEKNPGWLGYIGDYTTQLYRDYNRPL